MYSWSLTTSSISSPIVSTTYPPTSITKSFLKTPKAPEIIKRESKAFHPTLPVEKPLDTQLPET